MKDFNSFMDEHPYDTTPTQDTGLFNINEYMIGIDVSPSEQSDVDVTKPIEQSTANCNYELKPAKDFIFESANETGDSIIYAGEMEETSDDTVTESYLLTAFALPAIVNVSALVATATLTVNSIVTSVTFNKKYKTFPEDVKRVNDMIIAAKNGKDLENPKAFIKAVNKLGNTCETLNAKWAFSNKAVKTFTTQEHTELDNLRKICEDIRANFSKKPEKNAERRMAARLEDFLECSTKLLNMMKRGSETNVNEFMV